MKFRIHYGDGVLCLPQAVLSLLERADADTLKVLLYIASSQNTSVAHIAQALSIDAQAVKQAIAFWRGAGLIDDAATDKATPAVPSDSAESTKKVRVEDSALAPKSPAPTTLPRYTTEELSALLEKRSELALLVDECARVFGKVFNTHETGLLLGMVDYLGVDGEYLLLLLAHCAKIGKKSLRYVEKIAFSLYDEGITDLPALQERLKRMEKLADAEGKIRSTFGISSRALTAKERKTIDAWLSTMNYSFDVILRAYEMTVDAIGKPSIPYTNSILERWAAAGLHTPEQIEQAEQQRAASASPVTAGNSFDTDDFFGAALSRSFGGDFSPSVPASGKAKTKHK